MLFCRRTLQGLTTAAALAACCLAAGCSGTGDGGTGDPPAEADGNLYGDGERVEDLLGEATWFNPADPDSLECKSPEPERARVTGLTVVAVDNFDEIAGGRSGNVYTVQTPGKKGLQPYNGMSLRTPGSSPPDLRIFPGMVIDVSGNFVEFLGPPSSSPFGSCKTLPQIEGTVTYRFDGQEVEPFLLVPAEAPEGVDRWAVMKSYPALRPYIGMLVRIENVDLTVLSENKGALEIPINVGGGIGVSDQVKISNELYDIARSGPALPEGAHFTSITGVVTYFYAFKIAPRSAADFVP